MTTKARMFALAAPFALMAAMIAGCASVEYSSPGSLAKVTVKGAPRAEAGRHVAITTSGYNLLWCIPLASGDLRWDWSRHEIRGGTSLFSDQVGFKELQTALQRIAETRKCDLADVQFHDTDGFYAGVSWGGLIGAFFGSSHMNVSAILVPRAEDK